MSLTATLLILYAACLAGAIASPAAADVATRSAPRSAPRPAPRRKRPWRAPAVLAVPLAALVVGAAPAPARAGEPATRVAALAVPAPTNAPLAGPATVIDGATLAVGGSRVRLHGIAAPALDQTCFDGRERGYACGRAAAEALAARIGTAPVVCEPRGADGTAARCRLGADDLAAWLVENGYAVADRGVSTDYAAQDERAWGRRRGLWAGVFDLPTHRAEGVVAGL